MTTTTAPFELPTIGARITVTVHGGFDTVCAEHGSRGWVASAPTGTILCTACWRPTTPEECLPRERTGYVRTVDLATNGTPLVWLTATPRARKISEVLGWTPERVLAVRAA